MQKFEIIYNDLTQEEIETFERWNPGYTATGDILHHEFTNRYGQHEEEHLVIFKAKDHKHRWTPYGMARQTSKYIICARYDRYYKLTLTGEIVSLDAEDNNSPN